MDIFLKTIRRVKQELGVDVSFLIKPNDDGSFDICDFIDASQHDGGLSGAGCTLCGHENNNDFDDYIVEKYKSILSESDIIGSFGMAKIKPYEFIKKLKTLPDING